MREITKLFTISTMLLITGCATMNESECFNADWLIIGMEDGAQGRMPSYIGEHRSACAKYNITPDLSDYQKGHKKGVSQYCIKANGYEIGKKGNEYNGVCPASLEGVFLEGYNLGNL